MESTGKNTNRGESSLLLKLPTSMFSFDVSGNSCLMPIAVEKTVGVEDNLSSSGSQSDKYEETQKMAETNSVCQLEQPLLMRKVSTSVPPTSSTIHSVPAHTSPSVQPVEHYAPAPVQSVFSHAGPQISSVPQEPPHQPPQEPPRHPPQELPRHPPQEPNVSSANSRSFNMNQQYSAPYSSVHTLKDSPAAYIDDYITRNLPPPPPVPDYYPQQCDLSANLNQINSPAYVPPTMGNTFPSVDQKHFAVSDDRASTVCGMAYEPVWPHWLFRDIVESKEIWYAFSDTDSENLEAAFKQNSTAIVPTDGGRYDAYLDQRLKKSVYFEAKDLHIRRCTWFLQSDSSQRFIPCDEDTATLLEQHYYNCVTSGQWQRRVSVPGVGTVILESPQVMLHYKNELDIWPSLPDARASPRAVKRGLPCGIEQMPNESHQVDHLVFIVQGIGSFCDLRFRTVSQCVDGFRDIANRLIASHFKHEVENGRVGRVEFLPLAWHAKLHTSDIGLDRRMQTITLPSIPKLRHFTNDTLLDILLYSSPSYCQSIINTVASELNKLYELFLSRNQNFCGKIFVAGHSLGSLILFDILANQEPEENKNQCAEQVPCEVESIKPEKQTNFYTEKLEKKFSSVDDVLEILHLEEYKSIFCEEKIDLSALMLLSESDMKSLGIPKGPCIKLLNLIHSESDVNDAARLTSESKSGSDIKEKDNEVSSNLDSDVQTELTKPCTLMYPLKTSNLFMPSVTYPRLHFEPSCFFALGSPISMFLAVRGFEAISEDFRFPTCPSFFHVFHPYDPVAFRIEPLIDPNFSAKPVLIPHHKGRKRMHLEIRENLTKVTHEIKQKFMETLKYTWNSLSGFAKAHAFPSAVVEAEVDRLVNQEIVESEDETQGASETSVDDIQIGSLNGGRRIDFVLQEKPIEALNDYIFALTSHATYWDSEDTVLMILREIYVMDGITVSSQPVENRPYTLSELPGEVNASFKQVTSNPNIANSFQAENAAKVSGSVSSVFITNQNLPYVPTPFGSVQPSEVKASEPSVTPNIQTTQSAVAQPVGPPPLSGFVKKSPFAR